MDSEGFKRMAIQLCIEVFLVNSNRRLPMNCPSAKECIRACGNPMNSATRQESACHPFMSTWTLDPHVYLTRWHSFWKVEGPVDFRVFFFLGSSYYEWFVISCFIDIAKWSFCLDLPMCCDDGWRWMAMDSQSLAACQSEIKPVLAGGSTQCPVERKLVLGVLWWGDVA